MDATERTLTGPAGNEPAVAEGVADESVGTDPALGAGAADEPAGSVPSGAGTAGAEAAVTAPVGHEPSGAGREAKVAASSVPSDAERAVPQQTTPERAVPQPPNAVPAAPEYLSVEQRRALGRQMRRSVSRRSHAAWKPPADRRDPVAVLQAQDASRLPDLIPVRYGRMLDSPFAFYRGAAAVMAMDLATLPRTALTVQLCGDAHLANFGVFGSPERELLFDINDFDETLQGPFEWDLKRLATSFVLAARANHFTASQSRSTALTAASAYRQAMRRFAEAGPLTPWYAHLTIDEVTSVIDSSRDRARAAAWIRKTRSNTSIKELDSLTRLVDGRRVIADDPPLVVRLPDNAENAPLLANLRHGLHLYRHSLAPDRRHLFDRYRVVDFARKVVGVGSVATRAYMALLEGRDANDPLFLQIKEAQPSVLSDYLGKGGYQQHGERVVVGQRWMQAASDIFLGWFHADDGLDFYVRQLKDLKGSVPFESVDPSGLVLYARVCGGTLARAHARSGDSDQLAGYLGNSDTFDQALADFAEAYADQTEHDHRRLQAAHTSGRIQAIMGE